MAIVLLRNEKGGTGDTHFFIEMSCFYRKPEVIHQKMKKLMKIYPELKYFGSKQPKELCRVSYVYPSRGSNFGDLLFFLLQIDGPVTQ